MTTTNTVVKTEPHMMGMSNSICKAMAPPNISASEVEMEASTAVPNMGRDTQEVIQSHEYNKKDDASIRKVLKYELFDTLFSMIVGWAINSAMILLAAATFFKSGIQVEELQQAKSLLEPLLGNSAAVVFALALLMAGISSTITSGMAAGSIFAGIFGESYHIKDSHSQVGVILSLGIALLLIFFIGDPFKGLLISQMILSIQLPFTVFLQVGLTSSRKVMGQYVNSKWSTFVLYAIAAVVTVLNIMLLVSELTS